MFKFGKSFPIDGTNDTIIKRKPDFPKTARNKSRFLKTFPRVRGNISDCCKAVNVGRVTYYRWIESDPEFAQSIDNLNESIVDWYETQLARAAYEGNAACIIFGLVNKGRKRGWQHVTKVKKEIDKKVGITIELVESDRQPLLLDNADGIIEATTAEQDKGG